MNLPETIFLSIVQGMTEFLPVSSSGHLVFFQKIIGFKNPPVFFDILVHVGSLIAILFFFRKKIINLIQEIIRGQLNFFKILIVASIPAAIFGFLIESQVEAVFNSLFLLGISFFINSAILFSTKSFTEGKGNASALNNQKSLFIGALQALAILPGVSRSGSTISAGLKAGLKKEEAFNFSFLLAIPAILGALLLKAKDFLEKDSINGQFSLLGFIIAAVTSYFSLKILANFVKKGQLYLFAPYTFFLGILSIFLSFVL
jgi:undecaprenyl-diphosphatase